MWNPRFPEKFQHSAVEKKSEFRCIGVGKRNDLILPASFLRVAQLRVKLAGQLSLPQGKRRVVSERVGFPSCAGCC